MTHSIKQISFNFVQVSLVMDPAHLISPPRAHPSGISSGESIHKRNIFNETWFMIIIAIVFVGCLLVFAVFTYRFLYRRRKNLSKGLQHLSGKFIFCLLLLHSI
jgi:heme/copper-type cytochrome/quinol oxidase subunit 2